MLQKYEIKYNTRLNDCGIITKKYQTYVKARGGYYIEWIEVKAGKGHFKFLISEENYDKNPTFQENNHICFKYVRLKFELIFFHNKKNSDFSLLKHGKRNSLTIAVFILSLIMFLHFNGEILWQNKHLQPKKHFYYAFF